MSNLISEQHDEQQITFSVEERTLPSYLESPEAFSSYWDAYETGVSYEAMMARWNEANTPEAKQAVIDDVRESSILRADIAKIDGKLGCVVAGEAPWHGLGYRVDAAMNSDELFSIATFLRSTYFKVPLSFCVNGTQVALGGRMGVAMTSPEGDTSLLDGVTVSSDYQIQQPYQSARFLDGIVGGSGASFDTAGITAGGAKIWLSILFPKHLEVVRGDVVRQYGLLTDSYDAKESWTFCSPTVRTVCANTRRLALAESSSQLRLRHNSELSARIDAALAAVAQSQKAFADFGEMADVMVRTQAAPTAFYQDCAERMANDTFFSGQLLTDEAMLEGPEAMVGADFDLDQATKAFERRRTNRLALVNRFEELGASSTNMAPGTAWGAYNAVTQYANHHLRYQGSARKRGETRMNDLMAGRANRIDEIALLAVEALVS